MDGEPPQEEDFSTIPLVERSTHKNWKARLSAYNDVISKSAKTASDTDPFFKPFINDPGLLKKWCLDANAVAQEKGIEAVLAIVTNSGETSARTRSDIVPAIVEKALGNSRAGTKKKGIELCAMFVEVENTGEGVVENVLVGLGAKLPKAVAGAIACLKELVESFGVQALGNVKPMLKALPKAFGHSDKNVRAEGTALAVALYTYLGPALMPALADIKPVQMTELQKQFETLDNSGKGAGSGKPQRWTRKAQRDRETAVDDGDDGDAAAEDEPAALDPMSLLDPVNVLDLFPGNLMDLIASTKWKERLEAFEECNKVLAQPQNARIQESNVDAYGPLAQTIGTKIQKDANVNVVMEAAKVLEGLARGLGKSFGRFRGSVMTGCLERLKERKANVVEAIGKALDAVFLTTTLSEIVEDVLTALKSKNPQVKAGTLGFLHRSLKVTTEAPGKDHVKPMAEALVALLTDSTEPVRAAAAECLGTMMKILGERAFNPYVESIPEIQMNKIKDAFATAEIKYRPGGVKKAAPAARAPAGGRPTGKGPSAAKKPPVAKPPSPSKSGGEDGLLQEFVAPPKKAMPARFANRLGKKPAAAASDDSAPPSPSKTKVVDEQLLDEFPEPPKRAMPPKFANRLGKKPAAASEDSRSSATPSPTKAGPARLMAKPAAKPAPAAAGPSKAAPAGKPGAAKALASSPSEPVKFRYSSEDALAKAEELIPAPFHTKLADSAWKVRLEAADEMVSWVNEGGGVEVESEIMMRFLNKIPGWGEKNFQVSAKIYQVIQLMAEKSPNFGKQAAALVAGPLTDKLGDMKLKKPAGDALIAIAEKTSLAFVLAQSYESMTKQKAPKAQADALTWIKQQIIDFSAAGIPLRELIAFIKNALGSPNAMVRSSATALLVQVKIFVGADISGFIEDLNPTLLSTINKEFDKVEGQAAPEPTRQQADLREVAGGKGKGKGGAADALDDLIPRVELDKLVNQTSILKDSKSDAWKTRKEAFEALNALLEVKSNQRLKPTMGEIVTVLKKAMVDTNLSVKTLALGIITKVATGMGQPIEKYCRALVPAVASVCADQKATTRTAGLNTLSAIADAIGSLDPMYSGVGTSLESANPALRSSVLGWVASRLGDEPPGPSADLSPLAGPVVQCLEDRNGDVRKAASAMLPFVVANVGYDAVLDKTTSLKPASKATIVPMIQAAAANAPASAPSAAAPPPTPAKAAPSVLATPARGMKTPKAKATAATPRASMAMPRPSGIAPPGRSIAMKALGSAPSHRPPSSTGGERTMGIPKSRMMAPRPTSSASSQPMASSPSGRTLPFVTSSPDAKAHRLKRDGTRWLLEASARNDTLEYLASQMEPHTSADIFTLLFSKDHRAEEDFMTGLAVIAEFYDPEIAGEFGLPDSELDAIQLANDDLALKYAAIRLMTNHTQVNNRSLEVISNVLDYLTRSGERLTEGEVRLFVPALVMKLGDPKFVPKLSPIFDGLDKIIPASQVVQLLVQYGLEEKGAGKTQKNESLALIEKAFRRRGSVLRKDDRGFYEAIAKCIADPGTRPNALNLMALLQLQGESRNLEAVVSGMPTSAKDMLANRRNALSTSKGASGIPRAGEGPGSPRPMSRASSSASHGTPAPSRISRDLSTSASGRPQPKGMGIPTPSASRLPMTTPARGQQRSIPAPSAIPGSIKRPAARSLANDFNGAAAPSRAMQPLGRAPPPPPQPEPELSEAAMLIDAIYNEDVEEATEALKEMAAFLEEDEESFIPEAKNLLNGLCFQLNSLPKDVGALLEPRSLRRIKHLMRTIHITFNKARLVKKIKLEGLQMMFTGIRRQYAAIEVWSEARGDDNQSANDLRDYMSLVLSSMISSPTREQVYTILFDGLLELCKDITPNPDPRTGSEVGVILQCTYKRVRSIDVDLRNERIHAGTLLAMIESLLQIIPPVQWRRRPKYGLPHGDLPLRVLKTLLQRVIVYTKEANIGIYDLLQEQFGATADTTTVYSYIFRISSADDAAAADAAAQNAAQNAAQMQAQAPMGPPPAPTPVAPLAPSPMPAPIAEPVPSRADQFARSESEDRVESLERADHVERMERMAERMDRPPSMSHSRRRSNLPDRPLSIASSAASRLSMGPDSMPKSPPPARDVTDAERLVRRLTDTRDNEQRLNELHAFMKLSPENETEVRAAIASTLNPAAQTFVWRALDRRNAVDQPLSPPSRSPVRELSSPPLSATTSRQSLSGSISSRPSSMAPDEQMEKLKAVFARGSRVSLGGPGGGGSRSSSSPNVTRPLSEIDNQQVSPERPLLSSTERPKSEISGLGR